MKKMRDLGRPLQTDQIKRIEYEIGAELPLSYRNFLLAHNGGRPTPDAIKIEGAPFKTTDVKVFFGMHRETESENILPTLESIEGCKENQILPIAGDSFGCIFGLALAGEEYGQVYYFDFGEGPPQPYFVANDFDEFLSKIREPTPEELGEDETS